jgi:hypothetical protein
MNVLRKHTIREIFIPAVFKPLHVALSQALELVNLAKASASGHLNDDYYDGANYDYESCCTAASSIAC